MKKFLGKLLAFFALQAVIMAGLFHFFPPGIRGYHRTLFKKEERYVNAEPRRIVFIGGSNLPFGIRSEMIEDQTDLNPVNLGLSSGLGLNSMLRQLDYLDEQREEGRGDVVVFSLEYQHFEGNHDGEEVLISTFILKDPEFVRYVDAAQWKKMLDQGIVLLGSGARSSVEKAMGGTLIKTIYVNESYNEYGEVRPELVTEGLGGAGEWFDLKLTDASIDTTIAKLNAAAEHHMARGSHVVFAFPPLPENVFRKHETNIDRIHARLQEKATFPILVEPHFFTDDSFYDTVYHLRAEAMERRTAELIDKLLNRQELAVSPREEQRIGMTHGR